MKFNFKIQQYQTDAVDAVIKAFNGQSYHKNTGYIRDLGSLERPVNVQISFIDEDEVDIYDDTGFKNDELDITDSQLLANIQKLQKDNNIKVSPSLVKDLGRCSLDIEMETGTGKTYVYIKTMFELNKRYGWTKFIVVVPSIAIREGVKKSFEITSDHFMEHYGKRARFFVYNSSNLTQLDNFSSDGGINVMIINTQAFASSMKEDGKSKEARIIYSKRDEFGSRKPIDVIKANRPIIILDEPQKMGGAVTQKALKNFNPLFTLTVIASESYKDFVSDLQSDIKKELYDRPSKATIEYFEGKTVMVGDEQIVIDKTQAKIIYKYLAKNDYIDNDDNVTDEYRADLANGTLASVPEEIKDICDGMHKLVQAVFDESVLKDMISDGHETKIKDNPLNDNFHKAEFQKLWSYINHKYAYSVEFDSEELIQKATAYIKV